MSPDHVDLFTPTGELLELSLERYLAGDLDPAELAAVEEHLAAHPPDQARLEEVQAHEARFRKAPPPAWLRAAAGPGPRSAVPPPAVAQEPPLAPAANDHRGWQGLIVALAAAALVVVMVPGTEAPTPISELPDRGSFLDLEGPDGLRPKGNPLELAVHGEHSGRLHSGSAVKPGERLAFQVRASEAGYLAIVGLDAAGTAWAGYPQGSLEAASLGASTELVDLEAAVRLDEHGAHERLLAVRCGEPFTLGALEAEVAAAGRSQGDPAAPLGTIWEHCAQDEIILRKGAAD